MVKFFRKIRHTLLLEEKFVKYLKYAIGEIVLVVIGILIALQINNWNEQRKTNQKEIILLKELQNSLNFNKEKLNRLSKNFKYINFRGKLLEEHLNNKLAYNDSLEIDFGIPFMDYSFQISYSTYENLKSQGFNIIHNSELRLKIIRLHDDVFSVLNDQEIKTSNLLTNSISPMMFKYFKSTKDGYKPNNYQNLLISDEYSNVLSLMIFLAERYVMLCNQSIKEIDELLSDINQELVKL